MPPALLAPLRAARPSRAAPASPCPVLSPSCGRPAPAGITWRASGALVGIRRLIVLGERSATKPRDHFHAALITCIEVRIPQLVRRAVFEQFFDGDAVFHDMHEAPAATEDVGGGRHLRLDVDAIAQIMLHVTLQHQTFSLWPPSPRHVHTGVPCPSCPPSLTTRTSPASGVNS